MNNTESAHHFQLVGTLRLANLEEANRRATNLKGGELKVICTYPSQNSKLRYNFEVAQAFFNHKLD